MRVVQRDHIISVDVESIAILLNVRDDRFVAASRLRHANHVIDDHRTPAAVRGQRRRRNIAVVERERRRGGNQKKQRTENGDESLHIERSPQKSYAFGCDRCTSGGGLFALTTSSRRRAPHHMPRTASPRKEAFTLRALTVPNRDQLDAILQARSGKL